MPSQRLREYGREYADYMVHRPMVCEWTPEREEALRRFVLAVDGHADFSHDVVAMAFTARQAKAEDARPDGAVEPAYFCSQLVAAAWKAAGLLRERVQPASFWPGDCGAGGSLEGWLVEGASLGAEQLVDPNPRGWWKGHGSSRGGDTSLAPGQERATDGGGQRTGGSRWF